MKSYPIIIKTGKTGKTEKFAKSATVIVVAAVASGALAGCGRNANTYIPTIPENPIVQLPKTDTSRTDTPPSSLALSPYFEPINASLSQPSSGGSVDIMMNIDNSGSVVHRIEDLEVSMPDFINQMNAASLDFRIGVLKNTEEADTIHNLKLYGPNRIVESTHPNAAAAVQQNLASVRTAFSGWSERPLWVLKESLEKDANPDFYRPNTKTVFFVFADAIDTAYTHAEKEVPAYSQMIRDTISSQLHKDWMMTTIGVPTPHDCTDVEDSAQLLIQDITLKSGGLMQKICVDDYTQSIAAVVSNIKEFLTSLSLRPWITANAIVDSESLSVKVNGTAVPQDSDSGYFWNAHAQSIVFPGSYKPNPGALVEVTFDIQHP